MKPEFDNRLKYLSYSGRLTLHSCPKKYQLQKLSQLREEEDYETNITFAFGHMVGDGIQLALQGIPEYKLFLSLFINWEPELFAENEKQLKSFWFGMAAIKSFISLHSLGLFKDYELVYFDGKPAVELSFKVKLPNGFFYRGHIDVVLIHKITKKIYVLELKTSSANFINPAAYKNSSQAIGYSVILDFIAPDVSSYEVIYLVYKTKAMAFDPPFIFSKNYLERAVWINELMLDVNKIIMFEELKTYPKHGESCLTWGRECQFYGTCTLNTSYMVKVQSEREVELFLARETDENYTIVTTLEELITKQLQKVGD